MQGLCWDLRRSHPNSFAGTDGLPARAITEGRDQLQGGAVREQTEALTIENKENKDFIFFPVHRTAPVTQNTNRQRLRSQQPLGLPSFRHAGKSPQKRLLQAQGAPAAFCTTVG